jgi:hypothetical protein
MAGFHVITEGLFWMRHISHMAGFHFDRGRLRFAIMRSWSGLIDRSSVATMYQEGFDFHVGVLTGEVNESAEIKTCDAAMNAAWSSGRSAAKSAWKTAGSM